MGILTPEMRQALAEQRLIFAATVGPRRNAQPVPKGTAMVWDDDHILFADLASPGTMRNLAANPAIEINIVSPFSRRGYRFKGNAAIHKDDDIHAAVVARMRAGAPSLQGWPTGRAPLPWSKWSKLCPWSPPATGTAPPKRKCAREWEAYWQAANARWRDRHG